MRYPFVVASKSFLLAAFGLALFACLPVAATDSQIGAVVCGESSPGASITITQPNDDSIVDRSPVTLRGEVGNTSQIEIMVDDVYVATLAMGANQTMFETDVSLSEGTHTIRLVAYDICQEQDASDEIVITYQPAVDPSDGGSTPTDVDGGATADPDNTETTSGGSPLNPTEPRIPIVGDILDGIADFAADSGLSQTVSGQNPIVATSRIVITISALSMIVLAGNLTPLVIQFVPGASSVFSLTSPRSRGYLTWLLRAVGVVGIALAYIL